AIVCDGMGGHSAGEVASAIAAAVLCDYIEAEFHSGKTPDLLLREGFSLANGQIDEHAQANPSAHGMGCTCVAVLGVRERMWVGHAGDSRLYRVREGQPVQQLTTDHTMV